MNRTNRIRSDSSSHFFQSSSPALHSDSKGRGSSSPCSPTTPPKARWMSDCSHISDSWFGKPFCAARAIDIELSWMRGSLDFWCRIRSLERCTRGAWPSNLRSGIWGGIVAFCRAKSPNLSPVKGLPLCYYRSRNSTYGLLGFYR